MTITWQKKLVAFVIAIMATASLGISATHYIFNRNDLIYPILWTRGCSPTSASMVLMFYDYVTPMGLINPGGLYYGLLVDYYGTHPVSHHNVPYPLIDDMHVAMETDDNGATNIDNIHIGIQTYTNTYHSYSFTSTQWKNCGLFPPTCADWNWLGISLSIVTNHPFVWTVLTNGGGGRGHSLCAYGYDDSRYVITRNTWDTSEDWWYYNEYDNTYAATLTQFDTVVPGGGVDSDVKLDDPVGGETINGGKPYTVWWYQYGSNLISWAQVRFSDDDGASWAFVGNTSSVPGYNYLTWNVPNTSTSQCRIQVLGYDSSNKAIAADGSVGSFVIRATTNTTIATAPSGLSITVDGTTYTAPHVFNWVSGSTHTIGAPSPQSGTGGTRYVYYSWSDGGAQTHSITPASATTYTANFTTQVPCTITSSPAGLKVTVDGTVYTSPYVFYWVPSTSHTLSVSSPQSGAAGTRYVYYRWYPAGAQTHSIIVPASAASYLASFATQYSLTTTAAPLAGGTITPAGTTWCYKGQSVVLRATSKAGYIFTGWSGDGWANPATVVMTGPKSITGIFASGKTLLVPVLFQPANGATGQPSSVTLTWQDKNSSPQELHYKVRIKRGAGVYKNYTLAANTVSYVASGLVAGKTYSWNVQALGNGTTIKTSPWANGGVDFKFTTK